MSLRRFLLLVCLGAGTASAATHLVETVPALEARLREAGPGDVLVMRNGAYTLEAPLRITCAGRSGAPIAIRAESVGGVTLGGPGGFLVEPPAAFVDIEGFVFTHAAGRAAVKAGAHHVRWRRNTFACPGDGAFLDVAGDDVEIARNEFRDKHTVGNMLSITGEGHQIARRVWVHHNHFHDYARAGANGAETIRFGRSWLSLSAGEGLVERNLFVRCVGENELITNKAGSITYRDNTFLDSPGAQLTLRHGNDCRVHGNYFRNTDGLRVFGDRQVISGNYFVGNTKGIDMGNGDGEVADGAALTCHDRPDDCTVTANILVDNQVHYRMGRRVRGLGARGVAFAHNILVGGDVAVSVSDSAPYTGTWTDNLHWQVREPGTLPTSGFRLAAAPLTPDATGLLRGPLHRAAGAGENDSPRDVPDYYAALPLTPADVGPASGP